MCQHPHAARVVPGRYHDHVVADAPKIEIDLRVLHRQRPQAHVVEAERLERLVDMDFLALPIDPQP